MPRLEARLLFDTHVGRLQHALIRRLRRIEDFEYAAAVPLLAHQLGDGQEVVGVEAGEGVEGIQLPHLAWGVIALIVHQPAGDRPVLLLDERVVILAPHPLARLLQILATRVFQNRAFSFNRSYIGARTNLIACKLISDDVSWLSNSTTP